MTTCSGAMPRSQPTTEWLHGVMRRYTALVAQGHGVDLWAEGFNLDSAVDRFLSLATPHEC